MSEKVIGLYQYRFNSDLITDLENVIEKYAGKLSVAEAVGSLEMAKLSLISEQIGVLDES